MIECAMMHSSASAIIRATISGTAYLLMRVKGPMNDAWDPFTCKCILWEGTLQCTAFAHGSKRMLQEDIEKTSLA